MLSPLFDVGQRVRFLTKYSADEKTGVIRYVKSCKNDKEEKYVEYSVQSKSKKSGITAEMHTGILENKIISIDQT